MFHCFQEVVIVSLAADLLGYLVCLGLLSLDCSSVFNCGLLYGGPEVQDTTFQSIHDKHVTHLHRHTTGNQLSLYSYKSNEHTSEIIFLICDVLGGGASQV